MELITDRTQADVLLQTAKGRYGAEDLNRVERAVQALQRLAQQTDIHPGLVTKTDWAFTNVFSPEQWPTELQMQRYLENVRKLCTAFGIPAQLPQTMGQLSWEDANRIEYALEQVYMRIENILQAFRFSGEVFAGEENIL